MRVTSVGGPDAFEDEDNSLTRPLSGAEGASNNFVQQDFDGKNMVQWAAE